MERLKAIEKEFGCKFIRIDPDKEELILTKKAH